MKWFASLLAITLLVVGAYFLFFADRKFNSFDGAEVGMLNETALSNLEENGWSVINEESCPGTNSLVKFRRPDYVLLITTDSECLVKRIERRPRKIEL